MAKQKDIKSDPFLLFLASAVVVIVAVFIVNTTLNKGREWRVEGVNTESDDSPASMLRDLNGTVDDGGQEEFKVLEKMNKAL